ncbi:hypothetical protein Tco_0472386 [Tanacetum coccineum]
MCASPSSSSPRCGHSLVVRAPRDGKKNGKAYEQSEDKINILNSFGMKLAVVENNDVSGTPRLSREVENFLVSQRKDDKETRNMEHPEVEGFFKTPIPE